MNITGVYKTQHGTLTIAQNGDNITATYQENGVCSGKLTGNKVEGIWKNKKDQGLFEWTFQDNGSFTGRYKNGIDSGPMRGKWDGYSNESAIADAPAFVLSLHTTIKEIYGHIDNIVESADSVKSNFKQEVLSFVNEHYQYYWWVPAIKTHLLNWQNKIDDDGLDMDINNLSISGSELNFNPYDYFRFYFNTREYLFSRDEDDDEPRSFFENVMDVDGNFNDYNELIEVCDDSDPIRHFQFINLSKSILYCTIAKNCQEGIDAEDLAELMLAVNFYNKLSYINDKINGGDISNEVIEEVLLSFNINRKDFDDEADLWRDQFLTNWENVAQELLDNDVFDDDYIS